MMLSLVVMMLQSAFLLVRKSLMVRMLVGQAVMLEICRLEVSAVGFGEALMCSHCSTRLEVVVARQQWGQTLQNYGCQPGCYKMELKREQSSSPRSRPSRSCNSRRRRRDSKTLRTDRLLGLCS
jgi:hypothetical protein